MILKSYVKVVYVKQCQSRSEMPGLVLAGKKYDGWSFFASTSQVNSEPWLHVKKALAVEKQKSSVYTALNE